MTKEMPQEHGHREPSSPQKTKRGSISKMYLEAFDEEWREVVDDPEDPTTDHRRLRSKIRFASAETLALRIYPAEMFRSRVRPASGKTLAMRVGPHKLPR